MAENYTSRAVVPVPQIARSIQFLRGQKVILDSDLAILYQISTAALKRAVRRNRDRFPRDFMFQLTAQEFESLRCQFGISKKGRGGTRYRAAIIDAIRQLVAPALKPKGEIGFHVRETSPRYGTRKKR